MHIHRLVLDIDTRRLGRGGVSRDSYGLASSLCSEGHELLEHELAGGAGELVDISGGEAFGWDRVENWTSLVSIQFRKENEMELCAYS